MSNANKEDPFSEANKYREKRPHLAAILRFFATVYN